MFPAAAFLYHSLPSGAHQIGKYSVQSTGQHNGCSGELISLLNQEQVEYTKNDDVYHIFYSHSDFHEVSALHDVFEGIVQKHDHQLDQSEYDSLISVNWASIWLKTVMS